MNIGVMIAATAEGRDIAEIAREAENLGYESFFIPLQPLPSPEPELREEFAKNCSLQGRHENQLEVVFRLPPADRKRFFATLN
jgi:hypothetical protein